MLYQKPNPKLVGPEYAARHADSAEQLYPLGNLNHQFRLFLEVLVEQEVQLVERVS